MGMVSDENASRGASNATSASAGGRGSTGNTTSGASTGPSSGRQESGSQSRSGNQTSTSAVSYGGGGRNGGSSGSFSGSDGGSGSKGFSGSNGGSNPSGRIGGGSDSYANTASGIQNALSSGLSAIGKAIDSAFQPFVEMSNMGMNKALNSLSGGILGKQESKYSNLEGNVGIVARTFESLGWADHQIAGAIGRLQQESHARLDTRATRKNDAGPGKHSVGIAQWNRDRLDGLKSYAKDLGKPWDDPETQARYVDYEMRTTESRAWAAMQAAKTTEEAAVAMMHYERPAGYTSKNPTAGHGWSNTVANANRFTETLGIGTQVAQASATGPATGATAYTGTNQKTTDQGREALQAIADVASVGGLFSMIADGITGAQARASVGQQKDGTYVDPRVSTVAGRAARGEPEPTRATMANTKAPDRKGLAGLGQALEEEKPGQAIKTVASAVMNPIGFALDTIEDAITNSQAWNTPGPEGEERRFAGGFLDGLLGGMTRTEGEPFKSNESGGDGSGYSLAQQIAQVAAPAAPVPGIVIPTFQPLPPLTLPASKGISTTTLIQPFAWSELT